MATKIIGYRQAVGVITENCGAHARMLITRNRKRFTDANVRELAGTAPEYQRYVIGRAASGDTNPFRTIASTLLVYDSPSAA